MQAKYILIAPHIFQARSLREEPPRVVTQEAKPHLPGLGMRIYVYGVCACFRLSQLNFNLSPVHVCVYVRVHMHA